MVYVNVKNKEITITLEGKEPIKAMYDYKLQIGKWLLEIKANDYENEIYEFTFDLTDYINVLSLPAVDFKNTYALVHKNLFIFQKKYEDLYNGYKSVDIGVYIKSVN